MAIQRRGARRGVTRRQVLGSAVGAAVALSLPARSYARVLGAGSRLQVAFIASGGIAADQHIPPLHALGADCPCFAEVDRGRWEPALSRWPGAQGFTDWRRMFDRREKDIDAVMVGTPDHHHYPATIVAMMLGKHVYTQKPLAHTVWEARQLTAAARRYRVATQMGNQLHATDEVRLTAAYLRGGAIGTLRSAHVWTNRPIWRQDHGVPRGAQRRPQGLDWDAWIGPAPWRPFRHDPADGWGGLYHPFNWRAFWDFGCGALGDMACHELDPLYWAMLPGLPDEVELLSGEPFGERDTYRKASVVRLHFPAAGQRPAFDVFWYEGGLKPERPPELPADEELTAEGALYLGSEGKLIAMPMARAAPRLLPAERHEAHGSPEAAIPPSADGHHGEWYRACRGEAPLDHPASHFGLAGPLTEAVLLGCVVQRTGGLLRYDGTTGRITNDAAADALLTKEYRQGWDFRMT